MKIFAAFVALLVTRGLWAQVDGARLPIGVRFVATDSRETVGGERFFLTGGGADVAFRLLPGLSAAVDVAGTTTSNEPGTGHGLSTITLLAGPRYTVPLRRVSVAGQALFGVAHGLGSDFSNGSQQSNTATGFAFAAGGFAEIRMTRAIGLRVAQVEYLQTNLPNGLTTGKVACGWVLEWYFGCDCRSRGGDESDSHDL